MTARHVKTIVVLALLLARPISAQQTKTGVAGDGVSLSHLANIDRVIQASIERKELPGAVVLVARHGRVACCPDASLANRTPAAIR